MYNIYSMKPQALRKAKEQPNTVSSLQAGMCIPKVLGVTRGVTIHRTIDASR